MNSQVPVVASKAENALAWTHYTGVAIAGLLLGAMWWPLLPSADEGATEAGAHPPCALWDGIARESVVRLVRESTHDADLRKAGDTIFRLRRARRNCQAGWVSLACQDYLAITWAMPGTGFMRPPNSQCPANVDAADAVP